MNRLTEILHSIGARRAPSPDLPSTEIRALGFSPAFLDVATMQIHPLRFAAAPRVANRTMLAGFERGGFFYTPRAAARACREWGHAE